MIKGDFITFTRDDDFSSIADMVNQSEDFPFKSGIFLHAEGSSRPPNLCGAYAKEINHDKGPDSGVSLSRYI